MSKYTSSTAWQALEQHYQLIKNQRLTTLFAENPNRAEQFSLTASDLFLDYSKNFITAETITLLLDLAKANQLSEKIKHLFAGESVNFTEDRPALHMALRDNDATVEVANIQSKMGHFVEQLHQHQWYGYSGQPITDVVNIGIGGSDLGPRLCVDALRPYCTKAVQVHFVSNIDGEEIFTTLENLNPATTLFIVASKSFTTIETLTNANTAREWLLSGFANATPRQVACNDGEIIAKHFVAVTAKPELAVQFGIAPENIFEFWDWVGGRYSLWSSIGLPIAVAIGMEHFRALLAGAYTMDQHFRTAELAQNMPVILGFLSVWYINFFHAQAQAIIPYDQRLKLFPAYLQQLEMESNGKSVNQDHETIDYATAPIIWGDVGTNGQHAFHQLLHQGTPFVPVDFLLAKKPAHPYSHQHDLLVANCLAQSEALMVGRTEQEALKELQNGLPRCASPRPPSRNDDIAKHKVIPGNKPNNILLFAELTPAILGSLISLYEHKVFVEGVIWQINSFDQYGVELGKTLANQMTEPTAHTAFSSSTQNLLRRIKIF